MSDIKASVIDSEKLIKFIRNGSCDINLSSIMALGAVCSMPSSAEQQICHYCTEDSDGYVEPIEKNGHAFVRLGTNGYELSLKANGWHNEVKINYCPMCGRRFKHE